MVRFTKEKRKAQILEVATNLFVERGYHDTKTKDIAKACGVTEPVIYKHFKSKDQLFLEIISNIAGETFDGININNKGDTELSLSTIFMNRVTVVEKNYPLFQRLLNELLDNERVRKYYFDHYLPRLAYPVIEYLDKLKQEDLIKNNVPSKTIALALVGIMIMVILAKNLDEDSAFSDTSSEDLARDMLHINLHGILDKH